MELTEKDLRERGIRRNWEEVTEEAGRFAYAILAGMPTGDGGCRSPSRRDRVGQDPPEAATGSEGRSEPPRSWWRRMIFGG